eukprot:TRINITY_DN25886_c0_g1_i2.p1 TRINITY_DN25886_c0_g1~~TRINITY_DN25886_c0_g1_i2.p1  ORF type:complete len:507 (+),score=116.98 TRINITY_DN25886_c0_g1_i2:86-1606(+)
MEPLPNDSHFDEVFNESKGKHDTDNNDPQYLDDILLLNVANPQLATDPHFLKLKQWLQDYHQQLHQGQNYNYKLPKYMQQDPLKITLYESLRKLLREIAATKDLTQQSTYIQRVCEWILKREKRPLRKVLRPTHIQRLRPLAQEQMSLCSAKELYGRGMRTVHEEIEPAKERIKAYCCKVLDNEATRDEDRRGTPRRVVKRVEESPVKKQERCKSTARGYYARNIPIEARSNFLYYAPKDEGEQKAERLWFGNKNREIMKKRSTVELQDTLNKWGHARSRLNKEITRKIESTSCSNNFPVRNYQSKSLKRFKSTNRGSKRYKELYDEQSDDEAEESPAVRPDSIPHVQKSPIIVDLSAGIKKVGEKSRARLRKKKEKIILPDVTKVIHDGDKKRVDYIRRMYGHLINTAAENIEPTDNIFTAGPKGINTLSTYNKDVRRSYTKYSARREVARSTPLTHAGSREQLRVQQAKEIRRMKEHFAKQEIPCTMVSPVSYTHLTLPTICSV